MPNRAIRKYTKIYVLLLALFFLLTGCGSPESAADGEDEAPALEGPYPVVRVVDGDTIVILIGHEEEKVRLIGLDTPEAVHSDPERNTPYGKIASDYTKELLEGKDVFLEFDVSPRDKYGRLLAYVYIDDRMFNEMLLEEGHARAGTYPPNVKYTDRFYDLQKEARDHNRGGWANDAFD